MAQKPNTSKKAPNHTPKNTPSRKTPFATIIAVVIILFYGLFTGQLQDLLGISDDTSSHEVVETTIRSSEAASSTISQEKQKTVETGAPASDDKHFRFRNKHLLEEHFEKHGSDFDYKTAKEYEEGADRVIHSNDVLHKLEVEDNDDVYYLEATNEFVIVSTDGYIRTYFKPSSGKDYFNRQ